jgi:hypothetical protein
LRLRQFAGDHDRAEIYPPPELDVAIRARRLQLHYGASTDALKEYGEDGLTHIEALAERQENLVHENSHHNDGKTVLREKNLASANHPT